MQLSKVKVLMMQNDAEWCRIKCFFKHLLLFFVAFMKDHMWILTIHLYTIYNRRIVATFLFTASRANTRDTCSYSRIGRRNREISSWYASRYKYLEPPCSNAALVYEGKCIVSANRLSPRSLSIPFYLLCHGNIFILRDNTIKAGRVLADFWSNCTFACTKMPRTKKKNSRGKWAGGHIAVALLMWLVCAHGSCSSCCVGESVEWNWTCSQEGLQTTEAGLCQNTELTSRAHTKHRRCCQNVPVYDIMLLLNIY